jgi:hypothetical protein
MFFGTGATILRHPSGRGSRGRGEGIAEDAGRAGEDERVDARRRCLLQQAEGARDVDVDEVLARVGRDVGLMERGRVEDRSHAGHATPHERLVGDRAHSGCVGGIEDVEADDLVSRVPQRADECLAEVAGAARYQEPHDRLTTLRLLARDTRASMDELRNAGLGRQSSGLDHRALARFLTDAYLCPAPDRHTADLAQGKTSGRVIRIQPDIFRRQVARPETDGFAA